MKARIRLAASAALGLGVFVVPVPFDGEWTVAFDVVVKAIRQSAPAAVSVYALALIAAGAALSALATRRDAGWLEAFRAPRLFVALRALGLLLAIPLALGVFLSQYGVGPVSTGLIVAGAFLFIGMFIDAIPAIIILGTVLWPLAEFAEVISKHVLPGGLLALSGILDDQVDEIRDAYAPWLCFDEPESRTHSGQTWIRLTGRKRQD